ncbi:MAG: hypothetical protein HY360_17915 [Verrucomicrobia bacterium]|nr:hypothetical protein [Verrucomicrobiota bacterium]
MPKLDFDYDYNGISPVLRCPILRDSPNQRILFNNFTMFYINEYLMTVAGGSAPPKLSSVKNPSDLILLADGYRYPVVFPPYNYGMGHKFTAWNELGDQHSGLANLLFVDGSLRRIDRNLVTSSQTNPALQ